MKHYTYISEVGGVSPTGKSAFVFVRAMRACERAKLCVGALANDSPPARPGELKMVSGTLVVADTCWRFKKFEVSLLTGAWVFMGS